MGLGKLDACCTYSGSNHLSTQRKFARRLHTTTTSETHYFYQYCVSPIDTNGKFLKDVQKVKSLLAAKFVTLLNQAIVNRRIGTGLFFQDKDLPDDKHEVGVLLLRELDINIKYNGILA